MRPNVAAEQVHFWANDVSPVETPAQAGVQLLQALPYIWTLTRIGRLLPRAFRIGSLMNVCST
jgi:hypothetical protein